MSQMLPLQVINAYRENIDEVIRIYGFEAILYTPENVEQREMLDVYEEQPDLIYKEPQDIRVFIEWSPDAKKLRNLGIFLEDEKPIICWLPSEYDITRNSYMVVPMNYGVGRDSDEEYEFVDEVIRNMYNAPVVQCWRIANRSR